MVKRTLEDVVLRITHRLWNRRLFSVLSYAKQRYIINDAQFHELHALIDPTQNHRIYDNGSPLYRLLDWFFYKKLCVKPDGGPVHHWWNTITGRASSWFHVRHCPRCIVGVEEDRKRQ